MRISTAVFSAALLAGLSACDMNAYGRGPYKARGGGLQVDFPAGLKICRNMSMGYAYVGFSADLGDAPASCNAADRSPEAVMGVWTDTFPLQHEIDLLCRPDLPAPDLEPLLAGLSFRDRTTWACVYRYPPGHVQFYIFAEGVRPDDRQTNYYVAQLFSNDSRLERDLPKFREMIAATRIDFPPPPSSASAGRVLPAVRSPEITNPPPVPPGS